MTAGALRADRGSLTLALGLLWIGLAYNVVEGVIAVSAGLIAGSVALTGFGFDSFIEVTASGVLLWRLSVPEGDPAAEEWEQMARRIVGVSFLLLAAYIVAQAAHVLVTRSEPEPSGLGLGLAVASLTLMPTLGLVKRWNARKLHSHALMSEAGETLVCSYLSATLFVGLVLNAAWGWWWADIAAAGTMIPWVVKEGLEGLRGDPCSDACA